MLKLLLIRHGESVDNREGRMGGLGSSRLTDRGRQQCQRLAIALHQQHWQPSHIYTSPLQRAIESTALLVHPWHWQLTSEPTGIAHIRQAKEDGAIENASKRHPLPTLFISDQLQEFDAGILTGLTWNEAQQHYPELCQALETSDRWVPIPDAETPSEGRQRATQFISQILAHHHNNDAVWIVSHHWIMEHLISNLMGCDRTWQIKISNTALFEFWIARDRWSEEGMTKGISDLWQIKRFNDRHHLIPHIVGKC